mmetsp:Transcript_30834/g.58526  ORF Transcript_30834/g.58526 Transcript_30834/m.58526 type:complete len:1516 (+) Transcript_30834:418-4965(+)
MNDQQSIDEECCTMTSESTPLHVNTAHGRERERRNRSASYGSYDSTTITNITYPYPLTLTNIIATSPPATFDSTTTYRSSSCILSTLSSASNDDISIGPGNSGNGGGGSSGSRSISISAASTPMVSNVTKALENGNINNNDGRALPPLPSMSSQQSILSQLPPRHRVVHSDGSSSTGGGGGRGRNNNNNNNNRSGNDNDNNKSLSRHIPNKNKNNTSNNRNSEPRTKRAACRHSLSSRIKISTTLILLILGLLLCICIIAKYFILLGPSSSKRSTSTSTTTNTRHPTIPRNNNNSNSNSNNNSNNVQNNHEGQNENITELIEKQKSRRSKAEGLFDEMGRYVFEDYDALPTFSNFLPGVAGIYGKPVWSFYVNRGQGISSFGVKSKDFPIMEFHTANNAYQDTPLLGFRTFYQGHRGGVGWGKSDGESFLVEPFDPARTRFAQLYSSRNTQSSSSSSLKKNRKDGGKMKIPPSLVPGAEEAANYPTRSMFIGSNEMQIREVDSVHKIETNVSYYTLPEEDFGAFVRRTTIANIDDKSDRPLHLSILDGLARIQPVGGKLNYQLKTIGRTLEGWMGVDEADHGTMPFFRMSTEPADSAAVVVEEAGHFCLSYIESDEKEFLPIVYDTSKVFGRDSSLTRPLGLFDTTIEDIVAGEQYGSAKTSSAFAAARDVIIHPGQSITITTFYGRANSITDVPVIARRIVQGGFARYKLSRARELVKQITEDVETKTGNKLFDGMVQQMYLDNSLRGGVPVLLGEIDDISQSLSVDEDSRIKVYHLFSRIHGDLERDYNDFVIEPTFFSEGPGNFRDIAQNRRNDVIINPRIGSFNAKLFLTFIQMDGYNPLSVEAVVFTIDDKNECDRLAADAVGYADGHRADREALAGVLCSGSWRPGQLAEMLEKQNIFLMRTLPELIDNVAASAKTSPMAVSKDGYWADHWTYYMDLIESYLQIYPDREEKFLYDELLPYFFSSRVVRPRAKKYVLSRSYNGQWHHVRQLHPTFEDSSRLEQMRHYVNDSSGWYKTEAHYHHNKGGTIVKSAPIAKLFLLATVKFATRDAYGMGIEYEGGKPGWNDAMNGLVGMLGSGMPESYELKVLLNYLKKAAGKYRRRVIVVPEELAALIGKITDALDELGDGEYIPPIQTKTTINKVPSDLFQYWDTVATAREEYRSDMISLSGRVIEYSSSDVIEIIDRWICQVDLGIARAHTIGSHGFEGGDELLGITPTYFSFNVTKWERTGEMSQLGHPLVNAMEMTVGKFPLFLEGVVRMMKTLDKEHATSIYNAVKKSGLRDEKLGMYTLSSSLVGQSYDMGRMMAFSPGWLENQSVWTHMSYKYYLELLRKGMYDDFFTEMESGMLPFIHEKNYGRSLLECSSFIASSAFVDPTMRGQGFLPRLSGTTAEFLSMWVLMMVGPSPYFINDETGVLEMQLVPALPFWLFRHDPTAVDNKQHSIRFKLFSSIDVVYFLSQPRNLFGVAPEKYEIGLRDGSKIVVEGPTIPHHLAMNIRRVVFIQYIVAYF